MLGVKAIEVPFICDSYFLNKSTSLLKFFSMAISILCFCCIVARSLVRPYHYHIYEFKDFTTKSRHLGKQLIATRIDIAILNMFSWYGSKLKTVESSYIKCHHIQSVALQHRARSALHYPIIHNIKASALNAKCASHKEGSYQQV